MCVTHAAAIDVYPWNITDQVYRVLLLRHKRRNALFTVQNIYKSSFRRIRVLQAFSY